MKTFDSKEDSFSNITFNSSQINVKNKRSQSNLSKLQNISHNKIDQQNQNIDLELNHVNNLDIWKINTQKKLRENNYIERKKLVYPSTLIEKTDPLIKIDIINNIMQNDGNRSQIFNTSAINFKVEDKSTTSQSKIQSMQSLGGSSPNVSRRSSLLNRSNQMLFSQAQSIQNYQFFKNDKNKVVIGQIVLNKFQKIYNQEKQLDQNRLIQEQPRIDNTLKNFKNLQMTITSSALNINDIKKKVISVEKEPKKIFDFSEEMKRIETEKLDYVNCERKILQKMYQLQYNTKVIKKSKKQVRDYIYDLQHKLSIFNVKIILSKYERLERNLVVGYFQERKKGDASKFNLHQIKDKLKFDDVFIGYVEKLKDMKQKEVDEYNDTIQQLQNILLVLQQQYEYLKNKSQEIKENYVKCKTQLRDMFIDLCTVHLKTFLTTQNLSYIVRGFITIDEPVPTQKFPKCLDDISIDYIIETGKILFEIQQIEEKKPSIFTKYNQESENVNQVLRELAEQICSIPLLNEKIVSMQQIPLFQGESESNLNGKISFQIPDIDEEISNEGLGGNLSEISSNKQSITYNHYYQIRKPTLLQKTFMSQSNNMLGTDKLFFQEEILDKKQDFFAIDKKIKEFKSQLTVLKRQEINRLIELINTKQIKEEVFQDIIKILFGQNDNDRVLKEFLAKKQRNEYIQQEKQMQNPFYQMQQKQLRNKQKSQERIQDIQPQLSKIQNQNTANKFDSNYFHRSQSIPNLKESVTITNSYKQKMENTLIHHNKVKFNISTYNFLDQINR
ncbi:hypothetical protein TTHERM_00494800 (macronuclear) [Tetrahymena thermophila SB210]|uniref:Uncharacterized protein n=1 Tax=Tetrahymena thermophila (strain SB210) TaxID=312017 RepID=I7MLT2_TETTS|nr:hypothetical protein TTHERM_00494800 [Tetrahymena thermophila SB210]EAS03018.2 hypothetical protein TTHERM_00494800 [Tetrahymena thermophila SB210]|eukprot:XP_001023263.2 hypothetical protein TTHERM_00494800 [Tetrahymena thermophila SB210]